MTTTTKLLKPFCTTLLLSAASLTHAATVDWGELLKWTDGDQSGVFSLGDAGFVAFSLKSDPIFKTSDISTADKSVLFEQHSAYEHISGDAVVFGQPKESHQMTATFDLSKFTGEGDELVFSVDTSVDQEISSDGVHFFKPSF